MTVFGGFRLEVVFVEPMKECGFGVDVFEGATVALWKFDQEPDIVLLLPEKGQRGFRCLDGYGAGWVRKSAPGVASTRGRICWASANLPAVTSAEIHIRLPMTGLAIHTTDKSPKYAKSASEKFCNAYTT